ncbi:MAG: hypothetical protein VX899_06310 [Myxococcota bacterium]|nr:hypothetical protein [Myxococcota bacterium]
MKQSAAIRPEPNTQRKAAIAAGGAIDHAGKVEIQVIPDFDLDRTIFQTLEGRLPRYIMRHRVGKEIHWDAQARQSIEARYQEAFGRAPLPQIEPEIIRFMVEECDFDVEHADGSFLDHLYFCFEYAVKHYPQESALVQLLHSILGTGTNTFAMTADKIPALQALLEPQVFAQVEAFPSVLRLLYVGDLRRELWANLSRLDKLESVQMHRVIDNAPITLSADQLWVALNHQLIHFVDFMPVANWHRNRSDTSYILFRDLHAFLSRAGKLDAKVEYTPPQPGPVSGEPADLGSWLTRHIPVGAAEKMAAKSVQRFSEKIGHETAFTLNFG